MVVGELANILFISTMTRFSNPKKENSKKSEAKTLKFKSVQYQFVTVLEASPHFTQLDLQQMMNRILNGVCNSPLICPIYGDQIQNTQQSNPTEQFPNLENVFWEFVVKNIMGTLIASENDMRQMGWKFYCLLMLMLNGGKNLNLDDHNLNRNVVHKWFQEQFNNINIPVRIEKMSNKESGQVHFSVDYVDIKHIEICNHLYDSNIENEACCLSNFISTKYYTSNDMNKHVMENM